MPAHIYAAPLAAFALFIFSSSAHATPFEECRSQTGYNASVIIKATSNFYFLGIGQAGIGQIGALGTLEPGDELAALTPEGVCAGVVSWEGSTTVLTVWQDDPLTPNIDGYVAGDPLSFWMWDASSGLSFKSHYVLYEDFFDTSGSYSTDAIFIPSFAFFYPATLARTDSGPPVDTGEKRTMSTTERAETTAPPEAYTLAASFPNPFRSSTTVRYGLPEEAAVRLDVYDALGRRVATLVDDVQRAGWYDAMLHAHDLAAGLYVVRLQAGDAVAVRRVTLAR